MEPGDDALLRELHSGLSVVQSQQSEINRRIGNIETEMKNLVDPSRVAQIEAELADKKSWRTWFVQSVSGVVIVTLLVALGKAIGVDVSW